MRWLLEAYALIAVFFLGEGVLREGGEARSLRAADRDRGTTRLIGVAYGIALNTGWVAPLLSRVGLGRVADPRRPALGLAFKAWATRTLGRFYTRTRRAQAETRHTRPLGVARVDISKVARHPRPNSRRAARDG